MPKATNELKYLCAHYLLASKQNSLYSRTADILTFIPPKAEFSFPCVSQFSKYVGKENSPNEDVFELSFE